MGKLVLVLGMGRSGTSMLTGLLAMCGATLPDNLVAPDAANTKGYFEPWDVLGINEPFLKSLGMTWFDTSFRLQEGELEHVDTTALTEHIERFLARYADHPLLVVKEPRIAALVPYWLPAATGAGWDVRVAAPVRHPREVSASLAKMHGLSVDYADALWMKYNLLTERDTRDYPRVFVGYDQLLTDWRGQLKRVASALDLSLDLGSDRDQQVGTYVDRELRHHTVGDEQVPPNPWVAELYRQLTVLAEDGELDRDRMDRLYELYISAERMTRHCWVR